MNTVQEVERCARMFSAQDPLMEQTEATLASIAASMRDMQESADEIATSLQSAELLGAHLDTLVACTAEDSPAS